MIYFLIFESWKGGKGKGKWAGKENGLDRPSRPGFGKPGMTPGDNNFQRPFGAPKGKKGLVRKFWIAPYMLPWLIFVAFSRVKTLTKRCKMQQKSWMQQKYLFIRLIAQAF